MSKVTCYVDRGRVYYLNESGLMYCFNDKVINLNFATSVCGIKRWSPHRLIQHNFELDIFQTLAVMVFGKKVLTLSNNKRG